MFYKERSEKSRKTWDVLNVKERGEKSNKDQCMRSKSLLTWTWNQNNFDKDQNVNICPQLSGFPSVVHSKIPENAVVLGIVRNECHVMPPYIVPHCLSVNYATYIDVQKIVLDFLIDNVWKYLSVTLFNIIQGSSYTRMADWIISWSDNPIIFALLILQILIF